MKKICPKTFRATDDVLNFADCLGDKCAAYVERHQKYKSEDGGAYIEPCNEWSCAMMLREVWHGMEESK